MATNSKVPASGCSVAFELHPGEDLFDGTTFEMFLERVDGHPRCCINYDPSPFLRVLSEFYRVDPLSWRGGGGRAPAPDATPREASPDVPRRVPSRFFDPEDGQLDSGSFLENPRGFRRFRSPSPSRRSATAAAGRRPYISSSATPVPASGHRSGIRHD